MTRQDWNLIIPHVEIGAERIAEHQPGFALAASYVAIDTVVQTVAGKIKIRHGSNAFDVESRLDAGFSGERCGRFSPNEN